MVVQDDGRGSMYREPGAGPGGMEERVRRLGGRVRSAIREPGKGALVRVELAA